MESDEQKLNIVYDEGKLNLAGRDIYEYDSGKIT